MWDGVLGALAILVGLMLVFAGLRYFFVALPILAFIAGFVVGGAVIQTLFGNGIFSTLTSWLTGFLLGLIFAAISYAWWYAGALIAAGSTGAALGSAIVPAFGGSAGWLIFMFAAIGFVVFFALAFVLALPVYIVLVNTAFLGATVVIAGLLLMIDRIDRADLGYGNVVAVVNASWWWSIPVFFLSLIGILSQMNAISSIAIQEARWATAQPT